MGYRVDGFVPNDPNDPETATYLVQWSRADVMTGPLEVGTVMKGDEIRYGGYFAYDEGLVDGAGVGFTMKYDEDNSYETELANGGMNMPPAEFMNLEEQMDDTYGYFYRDVSKTYTIASQDEADKIVASGFKYPHRRLHRPALRRQPPDGLRLLCL